MRHVPTFLVITLLVAVQAYGAQAGVEAACRSAMGPYYAALLASARGDADGTLRHVLLLKARWDAVLGQGDAGAAAWLRDTVDRQPVGAAVAAKIEAARQRLPRDVAGAHTELEGIRALIRDARVHHGIRSVDDALTDYHTAMERLESHIGLSNEVTLARDDFMAIRDDVRRARSAWTEVVAYPDFKAIASSDTTAALLGRIADAAERSDARTAQDAARLLKTKYFDLLGVLARRG